MRRIGAADVACAVPGIIVAAAFAFRAGRVPAFRHDWLWPAQRTTLIRWLLESGLSLWNPHGLGHAGQIPTLNPVLLFWATLSVLGFSTTLVLFVFLALVYVGSAFGVIAAFRAFDIPVDGATARILGVIYGLSPICFQKSVAGHLWWLAASACLPWFCTAVRIGCVRREVALRSFAAAALLLIVSSTQIQFLAFDAFVLACVSAPYVRRPHVWRGIMLIAGTGLLHNAMWFVVPLDPGSGFELRSHATLAWETDMSGFPVPLWLFTGYEHYDDLALSGIAASVYGFGRAALAGLAAVALVLRPVRALPFAAIAGGALLIGLGLNGPLEPWLRPAILEDRAFIFLREFFHVMALYAFAAIMLAGITLAALPWRAPRVVAALACALCTLPFLSGGLARLVPAISLDASENEASFDEPTLRALAPLPEPIGLPGRSDSGMDPARFADDVVTTGDAPLFVDALLSRPDAGADALLADLGVRVVASRATRVSRFDTSFEPNVGAPRDLFRAREAALARRMQGSRRLPNTRAMVQVETRDDELAATALADREVPPGRSVDFASSHSGNDIDNEWVAARLWLLIDPAVGGVIAEPVLSRSDAPLDLALPPSARGILWVLALGVPLTLDGRLPSHMVPVTAAYRWMRWEIAPGANHALRGKAGKLSSVARVLISSDGSWQPHTIRSSSDNPAISMPAFRGDVPWRFAGRLDPHGSGVLVFARTYASGWHLELDGRDIGNSQRIDGVFNGWKLPASSRTQQATLAYEPQHAANFLLAACALVELSLLGLALVPYARAVRPPQQQG